MNLTELKQFLKRVEFLKGILPEPNFIFSVKNELHNIFGNQVRTEIKLDQISIEFYKSVNNYVPLIVITGNSPADMYIPFIEQIIKYEEELSCQA